MHDVILAQSRPREVRVSEKYIYYDKISGVRKSDLRKAEGRIVTTIPYDGRRYIDQRWRKQPHSSFHSFGHLQVTDYGLSRLQREPVLSLDNHQLLLEFDSRSREFTAVRAFPSRSFAIRLAQSYRPEQPLVKPLAIEVEMLDEDEAKDEGAWAEELRRLEAYTAKNVATMLVDQVKGQVSFKRSLIFRFRLTLCLPAEIADRSADGLEVARVSLEWPIATSPRLARLTVDPDAARVQETTRRRPVPVEEPEQGSESEGDPAEAAEEAPVQQNEEHGHGEWPIAYDPESRMIEWRGLPFYPKEAREGQRTRVYETDPFQLEVDHPGKLYAQRQLAGSITIHLRGVLSGLRLQYLGYGGANRPDVDFVYETTLVNHFALDLEESFELRRFSPQQHLQFPGIILDDMRIADVLMLLKDRRFEVKNNNTRKLDGDKDGGIGQYLVEAQRPEGTGVLRLWLLIQGTPAETTRERQTLGETKYTTALDTGRTVIYMRGSLRGDSERVVAVMNELQEQLKEHFRHVGTVN